MQSLCAELAEKAARRFQGNTKELEQYGQATPNQQRRGWLESKLRFTWAALLCFALNIRLGWILRFTCAADTSTLWRLRAPKYLRQAWMVDYTVYHTVQKWKADWPTQKLNYSEAAVHYVCIFQSPPKLKWALLPWTQVYIVQCKAYRIYRIYRICRIYSIYRIYRINRKYRIYRIYYKVMWPVQRLSFDQCSADLAGIEISAETNFMMICNTGDFALSSNNCSTTHAAMSWTKPYAGAL